MIPFRIHPHSADPASIQEANLQGGWQGARAYAAEPVALRAAAESRRAGEARLLSWILHPSEKVALALLRNEHEPWRSRASLIGVLGLARAREEAKRQGFVWTPLLDALAERSLWPAGEAARTLLVERAGEGGWSADAVPELVSVFDQVRKLIPWMQRAREEEVDEFFHFRFQGLFGYAAEHLAVLRERHLSSLVLEHQAGVRLASNPALEPPLLPRLAELAVESMDQGKLVRRKLKRGYETRDLGADEGYRLLEWLVRRKGVEPQGRARERLLEMAEIEPGPTRYSHRNVWYARDAALLLPSLEEKDLLEIYPKSLTSPATARAILEHPAAGDLLWTRALTEWGHPGVSEWLSLNLRARKSPRVRRILLRSQAREVVRRLAEEATPGEFRSLFRRLLAWDPEGARRLLERVSAEHRARLKATDLSPLLTSRRVREREAAIRALGDLSLGRKGRGR